MLMNTNTLTEAIRLNIIFKIGNETADMKKRKSDKMAVANHTDMCGSKFVAFGTTVKDSH